MARKSKKAVNPQITLWSNVAKRNEMHFGYEIQITIGESGSEDCINGMLLMPSALVVQYYREPRKLGGVIGTGIHRVEWVTDYNIVADLKGTGYDVDMSDVVPCDYWKHFDQVIAETLETIKK